MREVDDTRTYVCVLSTRLLWGVRAPFDLQHDVRWSRTSGVPYTASMAVEQQLISA